ncbi:DUF1801 domain-containing protein [Lentilactobacillus kosonis]|uniref:YdhG-like domain-containing protein n=1 Tax=Lentilactobacillus kosonis TaxID=2810561 RepID=A0A401FJ25_9LACO|nr:DUF1801 domain-containing protein [Lentilactobacillus kosonis]GAY72373.1 hypothetical protein NBRC111893_519 [Lentilactobacillus kosonis]
MPKKPIVHSFEEYLNISQVGARPLLTALKDQILSETSAPEEKISWGQPFFILPDKKLSTSAYKDHVSLQTSVNLPDDLITTANQAGYSTGQKRLNIKFDQAIPREVVSKIIKQSENP